MTRVLHIDGSTRPRRARGGITSSRVGARHRDARGLSARRDPARGGSLLRTRFLRYAAVMVAAGLVALATSLRVQEVRVQDLLLADRDHVRSVLSPVLESRLVRLDADALRAALERDPWILRAEIFRRLPGRVVVDLEESQPMFRLPASEGVAATLDRDGRVLPPRPGLVLAGLPLLQDLRFEDGVASVSERERLRSLLAAVESAAWPLDRPLESVRLNTARGVELRTADGVRIVVGEKQLERRLRGLGPALQRWHPGPGDTIDLRFERQIVHLPARGQRGSEEG